MTFEPHKFFIGLVDFFSILMPGALVAYLGRSNISDWPKAVLSNSFSVDLKSAEGVIVFFFASYLLGLSCCRF